MRSIAHDRRNRRLAAGLLTLAALCACSTPEPEPLRIGINPWPGYAFLHLAQDQGLFAAEGVAVDIKEFVSLGDVRQAFERGQLDGMGCTLIEVLLARHHSGRTPVPVHIADVSSGADQILARPPMASITDLVGRRVGAEAATLTVYMIAAALREHGLGINALEIVALPPEELAAAYRKGTIDAAATYPPFSTELAAAGATRIFGSEQIPGEVVDVLAFGIDVIDRRESEISAVVRAFDRAVALYRERPQWATEHMAKLSGIEVEEMRAVLEGGIEMPQGEEQNPFFQPGGPIEHAMLLIDTALRRTGHLEGEDHVLPFYHVPNPARPAR